MSVEEVVDKIYNDVISAVRSGQLKEWLRKHAVLELLEGGGDGRLFEYIALVYPGRSAYVDFIIAERVGLRIQYSNGDVKFREFPPDISIAIIKQFARENMLH